METVETIQDRQLTEQTLEIVRNCKNDISKLLQTMYPCRKGVRRGVALDTILLLALGEGMLELEKENAELKCQLEERRGIFRIQCPTCNSILKFYINKEDAFDGKSAMDDLLTPCYLATKYDNNV